MNKMWPLYLCKSARDLFPETGK